MNIQSAMKPMRKSRNKHMAAQYMIKVIFQISRKKSNYK